MFHLFLSAMRLIEKSFQNKCTSRQNAAYLPLLCQWISFWWRSHLQCLFGVRLWNQKRMKQDSENHMEWSATSSDHMIFQTYTFATICYVEGGIKLAKEHSNQINKQIQSHSENCTNEMEWYNVIIWSSIVSIVISESMTSGLDLTNNFRCLFIRAHCNFEHARTAFSLLILSKVPSWSASAKWHDLCMHRTLK